MLVQPVNQTVSEQKTVLLHLVMFGKEDVFIVLLVLFSKEESVLVNVEPTNSTSIEFVFVLEDMKEKESIVLR